MGKTAAPNVCILCELRILCPDLSISEKEAQDDTLAKQIAFVQDLNLEEIYTIPEVKQFFAYPSHALNSLKSHDFRGAARGLITDFLASDEGWRADKEFTVVSIGASFLLAFIQSCWTGRLWIFEINYFFLKALISRFDLEKAAFNYLSIDAEEVYRLTPSILLLAMARAILVDSRDLLTELKLVDWWTLRTLFVQQRIIENPAGSEVSFSDRSGLIFSFYGDMEEAKAKYVESQKLSGLKWNVTGALGRRTKFQTFDVAQLVIKLKNENPEDGITTEQMVPYVTRVIEHPNNWTIHTMALLLRSRLESKKGRTVERSALQLQALVDQIPSKDSTAAERKSSSSVSWNHRTEKRVWDMESFTAAFRELGERFISIGVIRSALEIFERLQMWDDVVSCLQMLGKAKEAEGIVRKQLEAFPGSPKLHCLLGDILKDPQYYYEAWSLSRFRYARAMRSLGAHFFREGNFEESVECYKKGLAINPLFENSWFVMGCAALRAQDWESAEEAFRRTISLDHNNGEAWTNLASVYVRKNLKREAWRALREALRQHSDNSKIWDNYLFISTDLGEFSESIRAMQNVLDLRTRHSSGIEIAKVIDFEVLQIVVTAVTKGLLDASQTSATSLSGRLATLLASIREKYTNSPRLYSISAEFAIAQGRLKEALEHRLSAYRILLQSPQLTADEEVFKNAVKYLKLYLTALVEFGDIEESVYQGGEDVRKVCPDWRYQGRSTLRTFIGRTKDTYEGSEELESLRDQVNEFK
ncbi:hypothetical protein BC829DRAFT_448906 [Chytridium lagenaria]|nr:hypothetical protein BC829DRAFT_448906 [Chytridium lagenaria]